MSLFDRARALIPGGVSSPARAFGAVGGDPLFAARGEGAFIVDHEGHRYLDYIQGFGAVILGHAHPRVVEAITDAAGSGGAVGLSTPPEVHLAELVCAAFGSIDRVRFVASGTEASMTAARIARGATGRDLLVKFEGCYHGHANEFLAKAGSGVATFSVPMAAGVPEASIEHTVVLPFNDSASLERLFAKRGDRIAAVFVEPVAANMGAVAPEPGFLETVVRLCASAAAVSVFDEVVTGFRLGPHGAQGLLRLDPDLTLLGKVLGGGLPIGVVGGRAELMDMLAPVGPVYQAGTYAAHPHAMVAGAAVLESLQPQHFGALEETATRLGEGLQSAAAEAGAVACVVRVGTFLSVFFRSSAPRDFTEVLASDRDAFARFHVALRSQSVLIPPSPYEVWFPSLAHTDADIDRTIEAARTAFAASR